MEIVCHQCERNAFLLLPEDAGTVTAECLGCGTSTVIEVPTPSSAAQVRWDRYRQAAGATRMSER
jgi:rRNA maturation protein Nop10